MLSAPAIPVPKNEPLRHYTPGSDEATKLKQAVDKLLSEVTEVPLVIGGKEVVTEKKGEQRCPADHAKVLCRFSMAQAEHVQQAIEAAIAAKAEWEALEWPHRLSVFLKAAELLATKYRYEMNAATILGQAKTIWQAEIDSAAETIDFLRFNPKYAEQLYAQQPPENSPAVWNRSEYRPLEGFVWALSPFNFTAIGANLCTAPAMMGNVVLWKPASTAVLSNYVFFKVLREAGLPAGVINFLPGSGALQAGQILSHPLFAGIHFTGSTEVFEDIQATVGRNLSRYRSYPRLVGETGGKDFHFIHASADILTAVNQTIRAAFEYQGQKCSACSRVYVPSSRANEFYSLLKSQLARARMGQPQDHSSFVSAVIDRASFVKLKAAIDMARSSPEAKVIIGGTCDDSRGWFIEPTVILTTNPHFSLMEEELFGPVLTAYTYDDADVDAALKLCDETSPYGLTGAVFATDVQFIQKATRALRNTAGNFYINDKCTGAVVGQQPFGGARKSGTNDKAGSFINLMRWTSARSIKEGFLPLTDFGYPYMGSY